MKKMLVTINDPTYEMLQRMAMRRGITVQMMLRSIVIPQWLHERTELSSNEEPVPELETSEVSKDKRLA